ncbi:Membrane protein involved in the export of O-antigen and teichoic acid [Micromonospora nigra]|uniref:Membrane protein involved in the export of O-antigen and teichoic acid n=1 Tax=Micromonospora nigra TaxID=145857 RepID=A0A1C6SHS6_9ACTN|nr:lipopolysaccharide biosynthesis protein [Micromonospora nigra]SCL29060.1 Membrane protein involved in the export of O-antigen and teichoic acid [Micromonospora nigra]
MSAGQTPSIVRAGALSMVALVAVGGTRLVHGSLTSHATDRATYGLVGIMLAASLVASLLLPGGISSGLSKFIAFHRGAGDPASAWAVHRSLSRLGTVAAVLLGVAATGVVHWAYRPDVLDSLSLLALTVSYSMYTMDKAALYGHGLVARYAGIEIVTSLLAVAGTAVVVLTGTTTYLLPLCVGYGSFVVLSRWRLRSHHRAEGRPAGGRFPRREVMAFVLLGSVGTVASAGFLQGTQLLAGRFAEPSEVAHVVAAVTLIAPLYFLPRGLALALFPVMAGAQGAGDTSAVRRQVDSATRLLATTMTPVLLLGLLVAPVVLSLFGGARYAAGADVLRLMLCAAFFGIVQVPSVNALASGSVARTRIPVASAVTGCLVGLVLVWVTAPRLGAEGVALGYLVGTAVTAALPVLAVRRIHRLPWAGLLARCAGLLAVGLVVSRLDVLAGWSWSTLGVGAALLVGALIVLGRDLNLLRRLLRARRDPLPAAPPVAAATASERTL